MSREVDALVAEHVFGERGIGFYGPTKPHGMHTDYVLCASEGEALELYRKHWGPTVADEMEGRQNECFWREGWGPLLLPDYSTEIADAWMVVEKMRERGVECEVYVNFEGRARARFLGRITNGVEYAATTPMAIALAALKAHGVTPTA